MKNTLDSVTALLGSNSWCRSLVFQALNFKEIIEGFKEILKLIYGEQAPPWILRVTGYVLLGVFLLVGLLGLLTIIVKIKELLTHKVWPIFYNKDKARRSNRRRKFADHIESELRRLNNLEAWSDYRFAELEAEVDAEGRRRVFGIFPSLYRGNNTLRREGSLSKAIQLSEERLIILEGDPGSGKSVALRHVASMLAARAMKSRSTKSVIPIYVNLKEIERKKGEAIDRNLIVSFVLKVLNRINDRDIEEFLDEEFREGLENGTWFFLFDSFDEIPEVLSSTEADKIITQYATAISDFLHGLNECRGVVASRFFHGPKQFGWPRFSILPLSSSRREELIKRADLKPAVEMELLAQLEVTGLEIRSMASNPMFLGLLCEHMRSGYIFPENSHSVYETYVTTRLTRDEERLHRRFKLTAHELRTTAEAVAFCMAADPGLGLSPRRADIAISAQKLQIRLDKRLDRILDAITYLKLARTDTSTSSEESQQFTFAHRRFQEYFSTAVVLREPNRVTPNQLLLDARWRETAVVLCQTQSPETLSPLIKEAELLTRDICEALVALNNNQFRFESNNDRGVQAKQGNSGSDRFQWPSHALHVLSLLQEGFTRRLNVLSSDLRSDAGDIVTRASELGTTADKKWALDVSGIAPPSVLTELLRTAFANRSQVLRDSAYRQVAKLAEIPIDIAFSIRSTLCLMALTGRLRKEKTATHAHLSRLSKSSTYLSALRLLISLPPIDIVLFTTLSFAIIFNFFSRLSLPMSGKSAGVTLTLFITAIAVPLSYFIFYWSAPVSGILLSTSPVKDTKSDEREFLPLLFSIFNFRTLLVLFVIAVTTIVTIWRSPSSKAEFHPPFSPWFILIWFYLASWAPSGFWFAREGRSLNPFLWPVFPILLVGRNVKGFAVVLKRMFADWKVIIPTLLLTAVFIAVLVTVSEQTGLIVLRALQYITIGIPSVAALSFVFYWLYLNMKEFLLWRRWNRNKHQILNIEELVKELQSFNTEKYRVRLIRTVRVKGLINISVDTEEAVYNLAREIETPRPQSQPKKSVIKRIFSRGREPQANDHDSPVEAKKGQVNNDPLRGGAILDEVLRLLEQIRAAR